MSINNQMSEMTARQSRRFFYSLDFYIPLILFIFTAVIFRNSGLDILIQKQFFSVNTGWYLKDSFFFKLLYHYGNLPALTISIAGLVLFGLSFQAYKWAKWRKVGLFLVLSMLIAPGLIVNVVLKDHWGRPRPRSTIEFGGKYNYEKVLSIDKSSPGYSFPCGHASMGFYLFIPWFLLRRKKSGWANMSLAVGLVMGTAIGTARIAQGGHYASDVIIAGIIVYWIGALLFYIMRFNHALWYYPKHENMDRKQRYIMSILVAVFIIFTMLGVALATPYSKHKAYYSQEYSKNDFKVLQLNLDIYSAEIFVTPSDSINVSYNVQAFGFPKSKLNTHFKEQVESNTLAVIFTQSKKGMFTELDNNVKATFPFTYKSLLNINLDKGIANIVLPDSLDKFTLNVTIEKGTLDLDLPAAFKPRITMKGDFELKDETGFNSNDEIFINEDFRVNIIVKTGDVILH